MPWLQGAQGNSNRLLQGTFYSMSIMNPYLCVIVGFHSHVGIDTTNKGLEGHGKRGDRDPAAKQEQFCRLTRTAPAYYPADSLPPSQARAAWERSTPAAGGAPSSRRGWRPWPCER